jgi:hypothetical protein
MRHKITIALKYDRKKKKYHIVDPLPTNKELQKAEMIKEIFTPLWRPSPLPKTITIILHLDVFEGEGNKGAQ